MRIEYDPEVDILTIRLKEEAAATTRDNATFDTIVDYDEEDNLIGVELHLASLRVEELKNLDLLIAAVQKRARPRRKAAHA